MGNGAAESKKEAQKPERGPLFKVAAVLLIAAALSGLAAGYFFHARTGSAQGTAKKQAGAEVLDLGEVLVNLIPGNHYLRAKVAVEYPQDKKLSAELKKKKHQLQDAVITALRSKTYQEAAAPGSTEAIKRELLDRLNGCIGAGKVTAVFFTDFVVQ